MWKYVSRRIRDTLERGAGARSRGGCGERACWAGCGRTDTNRHRYYDYLNQSWLGAVTWSSALALGWYATQLIHLKKKYHVRAEGRSTPLCSVIQNKFTSLNFCGDTPNVIDENIVKKLIQTDQSAKYSALNDDYEKFMSPEQNYKFEKFIPRHETFKENIPSYEKTKEYSPVRLISNDHSREGRPSETSDGSTSSNDLSDVLNSIENKLGLAAIESGHHQEGLSMLRSAAHRNHPPALYNLGLCYELGLGIAADEKMAMELYRLAATLEHPGALYNLAVYYGQGRGGLPRDASTATRLLRLAALKGQQEAIKALQLVEPEEEPEWSPKSLEQEVQSMTDNWSKYESVNKSIDDEAPTQTSLFVERINSALSANVMCEAAVY